LANKREGYESVDVGGVDHLFKADFSFLAELKEEAKADPMDIFSGFASGASDPILVRAVLVSSLVSIAGNELVDADKRNAIEKMITEYGLQEAWILAQHMLSYAMIGSIKKSHLGSLEKMNQALGGSLWMNSSSRLFRWGFPLAIFGGLVCSSTSLSVLLIWFLME